MRLYLDEDAAESQLTRLLSAAGHDVATIADTTSHGSSDVVQMTNAIRLERAIITRNHQDFEELNDLVHACGGNHFGVLVVRRDKSPARNLTPQRTVIALSNLLASRLSIDNTIHVLNHFR